MSEKKLTKLQTPTNSYVIHYPKIRELALMQLEKNYWTASEMKVELDRMELLYGLSDEQLHAVKTVLMLFLRYELMVGSNFWGKLVRETFPRPEVDMMCSANQMAEDCIHAVFYNEINVQLSLDTDEHYLAYTKDPILAERVEWIGNLMKSEDKILAIMCFSLVECVLLFSSFTILKSFNSNGHNNLNVIVRGTNQSAIDEDHHSICASELINTYFNEMGSSLKDDTKRVEAIYKALDDAIAHERRITRMAIPSGELNGITWEDIDSYILVRANIFLERLGLEHRYPDVECRIKDWFEQNTYAYKVMDNFSRGVGMEYETGWSFDGFVKGLHEEQEV